MAAAEVLVLGPVALSHEAGPMRLPAKQRRLLAALVVAHGRTCPADELVDVLWGENPPASARKLLRIYVSQLRKALTANVEIETTAGGYVLNVPSGALDAALFEQLLGECGAAKREGNPSLASSLVARALALWRGRAFGDLADEEFAHAEAGRLEALRLVALEERVEAQLGLGRHREVLGEAVTLAEENPFRERVHELAMLALYRSGRQSDALEHFASVRSRLHSELGLEPGPALRELQRLILQQDPTLEPAAEVAEARLTLPLALTSLVGRERELRELEALLGRRDARLIVLTGAGGTGKTRLALEAARRAAGSFANGATLVDLAPLRDSQLVVPTMARGLGVADDPDTDPFEALAATLAMQELLLVVDNAEHVREAAPSFARLTAAAPRLTLLVTSRAVLHVSGESVFPVSPLAEDDAVELFVQRARVMYPRFALTPETEPDVREICRRVDCLPLALELAAPRVRALSTGALRERLSTRLGLLTSGPRDLPARQQTLRETIAWSVGLVSEHQRQVFGRLSVFTGGATLEAAEQVCGADLDTLAALVDDHLVRADIGGETRFQMLETIREFALELLGEERAKTELAVAVYFARIADELRLSASDALERLRILERLDPELDNIRVALAAAETSGDAELRVRLAGGLWRHWVARGPVVEGLEWIERALSTPGPATAERASALEGAAGLAWMRGDRERAKQHARVAITVATEARATWSESAAHTVLGIVANEEGDRKSARFHHERSIELTQELGVEPVTEKLNLGVLELDSGNHETATRLFQDVLAARRKDNNRVGMGFALLNLGLVRYELGEHLASERDFAEARSYFEEAGLRVQLAYALQGLAAAEASRGHFEEAASLLGKARHELDSFGSPEDGFAPEMVAWTKERAQSALGDQSFAAAHAAVFDPD